ncbi:MAG TPA: radical SAM protein [Candidatus Nitrosocosmicus sp.]|nr:radical SAM protein [Candidatus Nitrosocosmicus sp.]
MKVNRLKKGLPLMVSPYMKDLIEKTGGVDGPIGKQFIKSPLEDVEINEADPQMEQTFEPEEAPGMIYKYKGEIDVNGKVTYYGRVLWTISRFCATYCRFCFRGRMVGLASNEEGISKDVLAHKTYLSEANIDKCIDFLKQHREINEVILSGGDPMIGSEKYLTHIFNYLQQLQQEGYISLVRIHTRAPVTNPVSIKESHFDLLKTVTNPYVVLHINHPAEITEEVTTITNRMRSNGALLLSQSVLLKDVNDNIETLTELFNTLTINGIRPYYLHQNDPVSWAQHFTVPIPQAIMLWQKLRPRLSGIADSVKFVIDTPHGVGKVVVPEGGWDVDYSHYYDFKGKKFNV